MEVSEILRVKGTTLYTVTPDTMLSDCVVTMAEHDIGSLIVMERGRLVGMLTGASSSIARAPRRRSPRSSCARS